MNSGPWYIDDTLTFYVNIHDPETGGANDADSVPTYRVYEAETATPILTGSMAKLDDDNTDGFYSEQITLSAANGFEENKNYCIRKSATVNGVTGVSLECFRVIPAPGDWTADEKEQIRYRLQLDGTQTAPAADAPLQMPVSADAVSQDETAADNLEAMLDGTRAKLYLSQLDITASGSDTALKLIGGPAGGGGIFCQGKSASAAAFTSDTGNGMHIRGDGGIFIAATNPVSYAVDVEGDGNGVYIGGFDGSALILDGQGISGQDLEFANSKCIIPSLGTQAKTDVENAVLNAALSGHTTAGTAGERLGRIPNAAAGGNGGLPTVDASNYIAGIQGTKNQLDDLNDLTAQEVRDAMKLAPTAGEPAAGSIDTHLDTIETDAGNAADNVGTAISLDGGTATLAGMLTKMADDNGGADFDAGTDSLNVIASDPIPELAAGEPPVTPNLKQAIMLLYMALRNASETERTGATTLLRKIRNDVGTVIARGSMTQSSTSLNQGTLEAPPETP